MRPFLSAGVVKRERGQAAQRVLTVVEGLNRRSAGDNYRLCAWFLQGRWGHSFVAALSPRRWAPEPPPAQLVPSLSGENFLCEPTSRTDVSRVRDSTVSQSRLLASDREKLGPPTFNIYNLAIGQAMDRQGVAL
jgi:hypothetical protein